MCYHQYYNMYACIHVYIYIYICTHTYIYIYSICCVAPRQIQRYRASYGITTNGIGLRRLEKSVSVGVHLGEHARPVHILDMSVRIYIYIYIHTCITHIGITLDQDTNLTCITTATTHNNIIVITQTCSVSMYGQSTH